MRKMKGCPTFDCMSCMQMCMNMGNMGGAY